MFGKTKGPDDSDRDPAPVQQFQRLAVAQSSAPDAADAVSSISADVTIVGKLTGEGTVKVFGRIEGELRATTVIISDGAQVEGDLVADDLTIGGRVKGTIHADRVKLSSTAVVQGDIFLSLAFDRGKRAVRRIVAARGQRHRDPVSRGPSGAGGRGARGQRQTQRRQGQPQRHGGRKTRRSISALRAYGSLG